LIPRSRFRLLIDVLIENKELVVAPTFTLIPQIFSLPFFIASFSLQCQNFHGNRLRYLLTLYDRGAFFSSQEEADDKNRDYGPSVCSYYR